MAQGLEAIWQAWVEGVDKTFLEHPRSVGESYFQHGWTALRISGTMLWGGVAAAVHAFVPSLFPTTASRAAAHVSETMARRARAASTRT